MNLRSLARGAAAAARRLLSPRSHGALGLASSVELIPSRRVRRPLFCGHGVMMVEEWRPPFWSLTIQTERGHYLHACLALGSALPEVGEAVSVVERRPRLGGGAPILSAMLRPAADLLA